MPDIIVEVLEGHNAPIMRENGGKQYFKQKAYVSLGGAYPQEIMISVPSAADAKHVGKYIVENGAFRVGKYGDLEINNFDLYKHLTPMPKAK